MAKKRIKTGEEAAAGVKVYNYEQDITPYINKVIEEMKTEHTNGHQTGQSTHTDKEYTEALIDDSLWQSAYEAGKADEARKWEAYVAGLMEGAFNVPVPQPDDHTTYAQPDIPFDEPPSGNGKLPPEQEEGYCPEFDEGYEWGYEDGVRHITAGNFHYDLLKMMPPFNEGWPEVVKVGWFMSIQAIAAGSQP